MTQCNCRKCRRIDDIDPQWLVDYAHKNPGVYFFGNVENIDRLKQDLGPTEWQRMQMAWRNHKQRQIAENQQWSAAVKGFQVVCRELNLSPNEVLHVLTAQLEASGGDMIGKEINVMRQICSKLYDPAASGHVMQSGSPEEITVDELKE